MTHKSVAHWFDGFDAAKQAEYQEEARQRWGAETVDAANERVKDKPAQWWQEQRDQWTSIVLAMVELIDSGATPEDPAVQEAIATHYQWVSRYWTPNRESYTGLGELYVQDPRFRSNYDKTDPRLAEFMRDAIAAYAAANLS